MTDIKTKIGKLFRNGEDGMCGCVESGAILSIPCDLIRPNRAQPRADFDEDGLIRLATSIKRYGIIQPLTVRKLISDDIYDYELIAGERRLKAARMIGFFCVPCMVLEADERMSAELAIIENLMRSDLNMFEIAYALKNLAEDYGMTQEEIAARMSMSQSAVANKIRLLRLSYEEQMAILDFSLTERHARTLLRIADNQQRMSAIQHIAALELNVSDSEKYIEGLLKKDTDAAGAELEADDFDKAASAMIRGIKRRVENFSKCGKSASMEVKNRNNAIELRIRIEK